MKIRYLEVEAEGEQITAAVREIAALFRVASPAALVEIPTALPAPNSNRPEAKREPKQKEDEGESLGSQRADTKKNLCLAALRIGPKTNKEVAEFIRVRGFQDYRNENASQCLSDLRGLKKVIAPTEKGGPWRLA